MHPRPPHVRGHRRHHRWGGRPLALALTVLTAFALCGTVLPSAASAAAGDPIGSFDAVAVTGDGKIEVIGWAADPRAPGARVEVHVYVTGPAGVVGIPGTYTGVSRPDVRQVVGWAGANQGFSATVPNAGNGDNQVCVYAINVVPPQTNPALGCRTVRVGGAPPTGYVDSVNPSGATAAVRGWTYDPGRSAQSIPVHVYVTNGSGVTVTPIVADVARNDVNRVFGITGRHGFTGTVPLTAGSNTVCAYGIGEGGNNALLGNCSTVAGPGGTIVTRPTGKPDASNTGVPGGTVCPTTPGR